MYLSVAKMECSSSLPEIKTERDEERKPSTHTAPFASSRRPSSSVNLNVGHMSSSQPSLKIQNTLKNILGPEPILVKAPSMGMNTSIPAVRITYTQPTHQVHVIPLSRVEIGEVWNTPTEISLLEISTLPRGWSTAFETFIPLVDYSQDYLRHMLSVLHTMQFMNDTPLNLELWKRACKTTNDMLYVVLTCPKCNTMRYLSMRTLLISSTKQKPLCITCEDLDLICEQHWDDVIDATLGSTSTAPSVKAKTSKTEHYELSDHSSSQNNQDVNKSINVKII